MICLPPMLNAVATHYNYVSGEVSYSAILLVNGARLRDRPVSGAVSGIRCLCVPAV